MKTIALLAALGTCALAQTAWEREMSAGNAALGPLTGKDAEQHFRAAVSAASSPVERASALTRLGLVEHGLLSSDPSLEYLTTAVEPLYAEAMALDSSETADHAAALELYSMLLARTQRPDEAASKSTSASAIRKALIAAANDNTPDGDILKIGNGVSAPRVLFKIEPGYSEEARIMKVQGTAVIYVVVGKDGLVHNVRLVRGLGLGLDEQAAVAVRKWKFDPGMKDGAPVNVSAQIEVNFRLL